MSSVGVSVGCYHFWIQQALIIAERTMGGLVCPEKIEEMDKELTKIIEDFSHAVNVETLYLVQKNGRHSLSRPGASSF